MSEPADSDFSNMENQFYEDCETLRKSEISEEGISTLLNLWETFNDSYTSNSLRAADRCLECLLICTAQLVFNVNYSKKISSDSKKKLKRVIISCGNCMQDCGHRQKLLTGIGSIIENPWQATTFTNTVTGLKSKKKDASDKLWDTEGWVMLESRLDYLSKLGNKCIDRVCAVLHVLVEKGHEIFRKNGRNLISFHPYEFPYHKYIEYLEVYALLHFSKLVDAQIVDTWEPPVLLEVISSLVKKAEDPNSNRLFPKLKQWKDVGPAGTFLAKKATWRALQLPKSTLLKEFFSIWMEMSGFVDNGTEQSESESPIHEIMKEELSYTENLYQIADVTIKLMGETPFTRLKYVELFVLAMTKDMTVIEALKRTQPDLKAKIKEHEERLSIRYLDLTRFFKDYPKTAKDCLITAFSLYPCQKLFTFLFPSSLSDTENVDVAISEDNCAIPAEYDDIKDMELELGDLKAEDDLDLGEGASDDLATVIHNPRYKGFLTLNSNEELKKVCLKLLDSKSVAVIENRTLDYVKVDYANPDYKDFQSRYDPEDDGIEQGYRKGDRGRKRVLQLAKRNAISETLKKAKKFAYQRARKLPTDGSEGVRRKGRPPKSTLSGDGYHSVNSNNRRMREETSRTIPNVTLSQNPWFPQGSKGGFYTEFFHTCIRVSDPPYKERSYGRNFNHEAGLLKSVKQELLQDSQTATRYQAPGSVVNGNTVPENPSGDSGIGSQALNTGTGLRRSKRLRFAEATTSGDIGNNHTNILNSSGQSSNETNSVMSNEPNGNPFFEDPFGGPLRKLVYFYTVMTVPGFAESEQNSGRNVLNPFESNEQVPQAVKNNRKRRNNTVREENVSVTVKKPRKGPARRSINVQSLSDTEKSHENDSTSNIEDDSVVLDRAHLESSSKEPGDDENLSDTKASNEEVITELAPNVEVEPLPQMPEPVYAGPFQIMATSSKTNPPAASVDPKAAVPENDKLPVIKDSNANLSNTKPVETYSMQKPIALKTYSKPKNGKRRLVITTRMWPNSDDKQLEAYKSAIPVVEPDVDQNSTKLNIPCTSDQANMSFNSSGSIDILSASSDSQASTTQKVPALPVLTAYRNPILEPSIAKIDMAVQNLSPSGNPRDRNDLKGVESNTNIITLTGQKINETILEQPLSQSNDEGFGIMPSSGVEVVVSGSGPERGNDVQKVSNKNAQISTSAENESSAESAMEPDVIDVAKNEKTIEQVCLTNTEINQHQNKVPNKDNVEGTPKLEGPKNSTTPKESNSTSSNFTSQKAFPLNELLPIGSLIKKPPKPVPSSPVMRNLQKFNPLSKPTSTKLVNSEVNIESSENPEIGTTVTTPKILSSSPTLVSNDHDASCSSISNDSATIKAPLVPSSSISSLQASDDKHDRPGFGNSISPSKEISSNNQLTLELPCAEDPCQIGLSTNDQIVSEKTLPEVSIITPLVEKSDFEKIESPRPDNLDFSSQVMGNNLCMDDAKDVICQLLDMVEQKENESTKSPEESFSVKDSALGESNNNAGMPKEKVQAHVLETETGTGNNCFKISPVEPSTSDKQIKENSETKTQDIGMESQGTPEKSHREDPEIICLDSDDEDNCDVVDKDFSQDNTAESDDDIDVECNSEIAQLNSRLLPHDALPSEDNQYGEGDNRILSENPRPLTPVEQLEKIINDKLRRKAKRPYDEEEDPIKVGKSVIAYAVQNRIRLRSLVACCVKLERLQVEELSEKARNQLETPVKRSTRLKKKKRRIVDSLKSVWQDPNTEEELESEYSESDSDIEILEIKNINAPSKTLALFQPKILRGMPQSRKRKLNNPSKQQTVQGSKILKTCSTPSNDSGVSGGNGSDPDFEPPSGSSTEVEDDDFEPGASSACQNFPVDVYPEINCNPLSPDEVTVDDQADPLAISDNHGRAYDQGDIDTEPANVAGLQVAVDEHVSNLQPDFSKSQIGDDKVNLLVGETKEEEDPECQDVAKENFTHESSNSDCEIIDDEESSQSVEIPLEKETPRIISRSLPPSATNSNLGKRLTRSSEHVNSRPTRLTTDKSQFYQYSSFSLDENSAIPEATANTEDTDYLMLSSSNESTKEAESADCVISDDVHVQNKEDDENISGTGSMYILPDENIEGSCNNDESSDSNKSMEVNTLSSTDYPTTSATILSDYGQEDHFINNLTDQQISHVTNDLENSSDPDLINSPQTETIPEQETCEALDPPSQDAIVAVPVVVNEFVEVENEEDLESEIQSVVASYTTHSDFSEPVGNGNDLENDTPISSPQVATISEQETCEALHPPSHEETAAVPLVVNEFVEEYTEVDPESEMQSVVTSDNEAQTSNTFNNDLSEPLENDTPISSPQMATTPEQESCEALDPPSQQDTAAVPVVVNQLVEVENEEDPASMTQSDNETHTNTYNNECSEPLGSENDDEIKEPEDTIDVEIEDISAQSDTQATDLVQIQEQQTVSYKENESDHMYTFNEEDVEDLNARKEEDYAFTVEEELSTSSEEFFDTVSIADIGISTAVNETAHSEFCINESFQITCPTHEVDIKTESEEVGSSPHLFLSGGENSNQEEKTCEKSPKAEENIVDMDEDGMSTHEDSSAFPEIMNIVVDDSSIAKVDDDESMESSNTSLNGDSDQDQEWVPSMHMDVVEPGSPELPVLTREDDERSENGWDSDDEPPVIEKLGVVS